MISDAMQMMMMNQMMSQQMNAQQMQAAQFGAMIGGVNGGRGGGSEVTAQATCGGPGGVNVQSESFRMMKLTNRLPEPCDRSWRK
jgi:hypothetical protein